MKTLALLLATTLFFNFGNFVQVVAKSRSPLITNQRTTDPVATETIDSDLFLQNTIRERGTERDYSERSKRC
jgi:hypothetical protein